MSLAKPSANRQRADEIPRERCKIYIVRQQEGWVQQREAALPVRLSALRALRAPRAHSVSRVGRSEPTPRFQHRAKQRPRRLYRPSRQRHRYRARRDRQHQERKVSNNSSNNRNR